MFYQVNVSLPALHNPSNPTGYSNLKSQTYCSLYTFLVQGCWTVLVPSLDENYLSILLIALPIDTSASSPHLLDSEQVLLHIMMVSWSFNLNMLWPTDGCL
jgi:hypothetical protein